ncbi:MAG: serine/threonine protein kinase [Planctomycetaceae bacterium]
MQPTALPAGSLHIEGQVQRYVDGRRFGYRGVCRPAQDPGSADWLDLLIQQFIRQGLSGPLQSDRTDWKDLLVQFLNQRQISSSAVLDSLFLFEIAGSAAYSSAAAQQSDQFEPTRSAAADRPQMQPQSDVPTPVLPPGYAFEKSLGRGTQGFVNLARTTDLLQNQFRVIKSIWMPDQARRDAAKNEQDAISRIGKRNLDSCDDCFDDCIIDYEKVISTGDWLHIVMQYVPGSITLHKWLLQHGRLRWPQLLDAAQQMAIGLHAAHSQGVYHRDLKPANVLCWQDGEIFRIRLIDFGIASVLHGPAYRAQAAGTPGYRHPGVATGQALQGFAEDFYGFAATLYSCATGIIRSNSSHPVRDICGTNVIHRLIREGLSLEEMAHTSMSAILDTLRAPENELLSPELRQLLDQTPDRQFRRTLQNLVQRTHNYEEARRLIQQAAPAAAAAPVRRLQGRELVVSQNNPPLTADIITTLRNLNYRIAQLRLHLPRNEYFAELEQWMAVCPENLIQSRL